MTTENQKQFRQQLTDRITELEAASQRNRDMEAENATPVLNPGYNCTASSLLDTAHELKHTLRQFNDAATDNLPFSIRSIRVWTTVESAIQFIVPDGRQFELSTTIKGAWEEIQSELINLAIDFTGTLERQKKTIPPVVHMYKPDKQIPYSAHPIGLEFVGRPDEILVITEKDFDKIKSES